MTGLIAITGLGVACPAGLDGDALWDDLFAGTDRRGPWSKRPLSGYPVDNVVSIPEPSWERMARAGRPAGGRAAVLADWVVARALEDAALPDAPGRRIGCMLSTTTGGVEATENDMAGLCAAPPSPADFDGSSLLPPRGRRWAGPVGVLSTACSSGLVAPAMAIDALVAGEADAMVAGGLDVLLEYTICGFNGLRLATPERCRPFAQGRKGVLLGEGGACVCLEPLDAASRRNARVRAVVTGFGLSCDADHVTAPNPAGVARAMRAALEMSGVAPDAIGGVFAHGTGTPTNDTAEAEALRAVFGADGIPPVTAIKSVTGHPQAGAGAMALAAAVLALERRRLPPTAGLDPVDPALAGLDPVGAGPGDADGRPLGRPVLMVNAFGFGGNNCVMIVADAAGHGDGR